MMIHVLVLLRRDADNEQELIGKGLEEKCRDLRGRVPPRGSFFFFLFFLFLFSGGPPKNENPERGGWQEGLTEPRRKRTQPLSTSTYSHQRALPANQHIGCTPQGADGVMSGSEHSSTKPWRTKRNPYPHRRIRTPKRGSHYSDRGALKTPASDMNHDPGERVEDRPLDPKFTFT